MNMRKLWLCAAVLAALAPVQPAAGGDALLSENFVLEAVTPRIFAPAAGVTTINRVRFTFSNPDNCAVTIRIFDMGGALVKRNISSESDTVMYWDGTDNSGAIVKGGIYIYQIDAGRKSLSGTIIVAQ